MFASRASSLRRIGLGQSTAAAARSTMSPRPTPSFLPAAASASSFSAAAGSQSHRRHEYRHHHNQSASFQRSTIFFAAASALAASTGAAFLGSSDAAQCEASGDAADCTEDEGELPTYTMDQVKRNNGKGPSKRIWMTYGGNVYDTTDFIANHPGGSEKILLAAGGPIEPHWHLYRQHFATDLPQQLMEKMLIGQLDEADQDKVDDDMERLTEREGADPYENEPERSPNLKIHGDQPMNAEVTPEVLRREYITPVEEFYIRHHHPVPLLSEREVENFRLEVDLSLLSKKQESTSYSKKSVAKLSLDQIKSLPKVEVTTTLQCSGNRRSGFNELRRTSGTPWGQGAISTAKWGGARLADVLVMASEQVADGSTDSAQRSLDKNDGSCPDGIAKSLQNLHTVLDEHPNLQHLRFESLDGMLASIDVIKALSPFGDVIVAYEMNGEPLPRDHGYPLRVIVPGYAAVRNVKWLSKLELASAEATGAWQRGLNYKVLPPSVLDAKEVDLDQMPGLGEVSVFSGITSVSRLDGDETKMVPGETVLVKASGWAWAGGGRNIVRVDVTGDGGKSWSNTDITEGSDQQYGRAWAWVFWECPSVPATLCQDGISVELSCKGVDIAFNTQPESSDGMWNVRGLANNSWFRLRQKVA